MEYRRLAVLAIWVGLAATVSVACSSRSAREILAEKQSGSRARASSYGADGFYDEGNFPHKGSVQKDSEFFFKRCNLVGRNPYPSASDWECTEAQ